MSTLNVRCALHTNTRYLPLTVTRIRSWSALQIIMAQVPLVSTDPIEVLTNKYLIEEPCVNKYWGPGLGAGFMFALACGSNWFIRRPMLSGIQKHVVFTILGGFLGKYIDSNRSEYLAERDAVLRHYIELHRDDFPDFERKKYSEVFEPWVPIR
ncbi:hypothetical protein PPYR_06679 [Photinus pyralis]|uniref:NADH dehydrogenase [ubiquinone] 1 subunit C2 n=4 Tax=Photinus pyralis TaxID=7054 RepID=A0A5N4AN96_PHOPY|nr:hypothetical protein PPYR_06679 [Photinus pyralis]